ncbi:MFS transporter [Microbacterium halophytorum]|uniref:MFS transporter n=1 Tax=Microbacterium halophytorum TaxID=2067568 RepID=UPI001E2AD292|nr:MFS transporter [Microbacterium halophytorum]
MAARTMHTRSMSGVGELDLRGGMANVVLATLASAVGFWAWMIIAPLQARYATEMGLTEGQISLMLATPVLVGSLGRVVVGALADRLGGRRMFTALLLASVPGVLLVVVAGENGSFGLLITGGFVLGVAGTIFAVGIPFSSAWFPPDKRGLATGIFGMGMIGTALAAFATPRLERVVGYVPTHLIVVALLLMMAVLTWVLLRESPAWRQSTEPVVPKVVGALKLRITWEMSLLYAIVFGGFVAFSTFLPKYLVTIYPDDVDVVGAGTRAATFAAAAVVARPIGGVLADKLGPKLITLVSLASLVALGYVVGQQPAEGIVAGLTFILLAAAMGLGMGSVYAWIGSSSPPGRAGAVAGVVAAAGGLGGYIPPLVMGATYDPVSNSYHLGLWLLVVSAAFALVLTGLLPPGRERT